MKLLTVKEVADFLKAKQSTVYSWAEQGLIPSFKINGLLRFDDDAIQAWIKTLAEKKSYNIPVGGRSRKGERK